METETRGRGTGELQLLGEHKVVPEIPHPAATELLRRREPEKPRRPRLRERITIDDALALPALVVGQHLLREKLPEARPEQLVLLAEQHPVHDRPTYSGPVLRPRAGSAVVARPAVYEEGLAGHEVAGSGEIHDGRSNVTVRIAVAT